MKTIILKKEFKINAPIQYAFSLICPVLEYKWIAGWKAKLIFCPNGKNEKGVIFEEKISTPFIMGKAFGKTMWRTLNYDTENYKALFSWDNKISTSIFKVEMYSIGVNQVTCIFKLNMSSINEEGEKIFNQKHAYKTDFLLTGLGRMLQYFCENSTMFKPKNSTHKVEFLDNLTWREKCVFLLNKWNLKFTYDRDKKSFLSYGMIREGTLYKKPVNN